MNEEAARSAQRHRYRGHVGHAQATRGRPHLLPLRGQAVAEAFFLALEGNPEQAGRPLDSERVAAWLRRPSTLTMLCRCQRLPSTAARLPSLLVHAAHCFRGARGLRRTASAPPRRAAPRRQCRAALCHSGGRPQRPLPLAGRRAGYPQPAPTVNKAGCGLRQTQHGHGRHGAVQLSTSSAVLINAYPERETTEPLSPHADVNTLLALAPPTCGLPTNTAQQTATVASAILLGTDLAPREGR